MGSDLFQPRNCLRVQRRVALLVVALVVAVALATGGAAQSGAGLPAGGFDRLDVAPDDVVIEVAVRPDGDAIWETQYRVRLAGDDEKQAFAELREDVESDPSAYSERFGGRMRMTAATAENATGREMNVTNVTVAAERRELPQSYGVLTYRFEWEGFAAVEDGRIRVGDAVDALFLDESSSLIVTWPEEYQLGDASPSPTETRENAVVWRGPVDFTEGQPRVAIEPASGAAGPLVLVAVGLLVAVVAAVGYRRRPWAKGDTERGVGATRAAADEPAATPTDSGAETNAGADPADASGSPDAEASESEPAAVGTETESADPGASDAAPPVDEDLLSNEEQVLRLIEAEGGRMKQKRVAEALGWTAAKTSQVVTGLRDDDDLDGFRLGRENVLSLPDYDAAGEGGGGSPGDDTNSSDDDGPEDSEGE